MRKIIYIAFLLFFLTKSMAQQTVCYGTSRTFSVTYKAGNTYAWAITPAVSGVAVPTISDTDNEITVNWGSTPIGKYTLTVTETSSVSCSGNAVSMDVYIIGNPTITVSPALPEICASDTVLITPAITAGAKTGISGEPTSTGTDTYAWTAPAGYVGTTTSSTITAGTGGIGGNYTLKYTDSYGCVATATSTLTVNPLPSNTITATGAKEFCYGGSVNLQAPSSATLPTTGGLTYQWYKDGATDATIQTIAVFGASNAYKQSVYTVKVTDSKGCTATSSGTTITVNPIPTVSISGTSDFCSNSSNSLTGTATNVTGSLATSFTYNWTRGLSTTSLGTATSYSVTETVAGAYTYNFTATDNKLCSNTISKTVNSRPVPVPVLSSTGSINLCAGNSVVLNDTETVPTASNFNYNWTWSGDFTGSTSGNSLTISSISTDSNSTTTYTLTTKDIAYSTNCQATASVTVNVKALPITSAINAPQTVCYEATSNISVTNTAGNTYAWSVSPAISSSIATTTATASVNWGNATNGKYTLKVIETDGTTTCPGTPVTADVYIVNKPTITVSPTTKEICYGDANITFQATITSATATSGAPAGTITPYYAWTVPAAYSGTINTTTINTDKAGTYSIQYTDNYGCSANASSTLIVNPLPSSTITPNGATEFCFGKTVVLSAPLTPTAPTTGQLSYTWYKNGTVDTSNVLSVYTVSTSSTITLKVTDIKGCSNTSPSGIAVIVNPNPIVTISGSSSNFNFCSNTSLVLTANATSGTGSLTYSWTKDTNTNPVSTNSTYTVSETQPSSYNYNVKVTDTKSCSTTKSETIFSRPVPVPVLSSTGTISICAGNTIVIEDKETLPVGSDFSYNWSWSGGRSGSASNTGNPYQIVSSTTDPSTTSTYTLKTIDTAYPTNCFGSASVVVKIIGLPETSDINEY